MNPKTKQQMKTEWLEALRSGDYPQVRGTLKGVTEGGEVGYCCLGVFCSVVLEEDPQLYENHDEVYSNLKNLLLGVDRRGIRMNDRGDSFLAIADMIEKGWEVSNNE